MFRCVLCLKSFVADDATEEHVFPDALGGLLTLRDMCAACNSHLGEMIDAPLANHHYMLWSRRKLKLATRAGKVPNPLEHGEVPATRQRVRWELDGRVYFHPSEQRRENGETVLVVDSSDEDRLQEMLAKRERRRGQKARGEVIPPNADLSLSFELNFDDESYRLGIAKVAYELGCKVLGERYLDDPIAARFRSVLSSRSPSHELIGASGIVAKIRGLYGPAMLHLPQHRDSWLTGVVFRLSGSVHVYVRLFDRFDGSFVLSEDASAYSCSESGNGWLIDVAMRTIRETSLDELRAMGSDAAR